MSVRFRLRPHVLEADGDGAWVGILPSGPVLRVSESGRWILEILARPAESGPDPDPAADRAGAPAPSARGATVAEVAAVLRHDLDHTPADLEDVVTIFLTAMTRSGLVETEEEP